MSTNDQALDTLGKTKWRINKRLLGIVDRIWASGGCLADLVDRNDVSGSSFCASIFKRERERRKHPTWKTDESFKFCIFQIPLPEKPDTEDEELIKKWKWKVKSVKKENRERHSQRCDIELKLTVRLVSICLMLSCSAYIMSIV